MAQGGVKTTLIDPIDVADELIVNRTEGGVMTTGRQPVGSFAAQLLADGPVKQENDARKVEIAETQQAIADGLADVENKIDAAVTTYNVSYELQATLIADLAWPANAMARIFGDTDPDLNGVYKKSGASGGGAWTRLGPLPGAGDVINLKAGNAATVAGIIDYLLTTPANVRAVFSARLGSMTATDLPPETGYTWGVIDALFRLALGIDTEGKVFLNLRDDVVVPRRVLSDDVRNALLSGVSGSGILGDESGFRWVIEDADHNVGLGLYPDGTFWCRLADDVEYPVPLTSAVEAQVRATLMGSEAIVGWGDSLMTSAFTDTLSAALGGRTVVNKGMGGQGSTQIATRQGSRPLTVSVAGAQIPASGAVDVTAKSSNILMLNGAPSGTSVGEIRGVHGTLSTDGSGNWTFTRTADGSAVACPDDSVFTLDDAATYRSYRPLLLAVRNDARSTRADHIATRDNLLAMVGWSEADISRALVMACVNGTGEGNGSAAYTHIMAINAELKATFGDRFIDHRRYLIDFGLADAGLTPTSQDLADIAADTVPEQLRIDIVHGTSTYYTLAANFVARHIKARGF